jgi:hypothetical protein
VPEISIRRSFARPLTEVPVLEGLGSVDDIMDELLEMTQVILGRKKPPVDFGVMTRHEVALAYFARVTEIELLIYEHERKKLGVKGDPFTQLRTKQVRAMLEMLKTQVSAGSRQLTHEMHLYKMQTDAEGTS